MREELLVSKEQCRNAFEQASLHPNPCTLTPAPWKAQGPGSRVRGEVQGPGSRVRVECQGFRVQCSGSRGLWEELLVSKEQCRHAFEQATPSPKLWGYNPV